jgi:hypothetical protein
MSKQLNGLAKESMHNSAQNLSDAPLSSQYAKY